MKDIFKASTGYMALAALVGIILGMIMLFYPGGTMILMASAFWVLQLFLSIFILYYTISEARHYFKTRHGGTGVWYLLIGVAATIFIWLLNVGVIYLIVAFFLILTGIGELIGSFHARGETFFIALLGIINLMVGILILSNPLILPLLIAWYVLFWGISRLFLAMELRRIYTR